MRTLTRHFSQQFARFVPWAGWTLLFGVAYAQAPLYTSNQNQYFLHGAAAAGLGTLAEDWLANTVDPTPVFSALVALTYRALPEAMFYAYDFLLFGVYLYSLSGLAVVPTPPQSPAQNKGLLLLLVLLHSAALRYGLSWAPGEHWSHLFEAGVAGQRLLGPVFQPSSFGVLLPLSILLFLRKRPCLAVTAAVLAATVHPTYLLSAAMLGATYVLVLLRARNWRAALGCGAIGALLASPILTYTWSVFRPSGATIAAEASRILVDVRIPHHALPTVWFDASVIAKLAFVAAALWLTRRTPLFPLLLLPTVFSLGLTALQLATSSPRLALLFPWRPSTWLVPISLSLIAAQLTAWVWARWPDVFGPPRRYLAAAGLTLALLLGAAGLVSFGYDLRRQASDPAWPVMDYVARTAASGEMYFIPPKLQDFRLASRAPAFVDFKSIPYRDAEVVAWYDRLRVAQSFFRDSPEGIDCRLLDRVAASGVTHVILGPEQRGLSCDGFEPLFDDGSYQLFRLALR